jgi:alpha-1,2-mannosyltransferase
VVEADRRLAAGIGWLPIVGIVLLTLLARAVPVLLGAGLWGDLGYDDGVYYGAAAALVHGALPYRDVLFLHPPGIIILLSPFAAIGALTNDATGMAIARCAFIALGVANALLVARLASTHSRSAGILAGVLYAVWHAAAGYERTTLLGPPQTTLLLVGLVALHQGMQTGRSAVTGRRQLIAGVMLGLAATIQLWGFVPLVVIGAWLAVRLSRDDGRPRLPTAFAIGAAVAVAAMLLPFLVTTGDAMLRQIVTDQLGRPNNAVSIAERLRSLEGLGQTRPHLPDVVPIGAALVGAVGVGWIFIKSSWVRIFAVLFAIQTAVVLIGPVFFPHYAAWPAGPGAVTFGVGGSMLVLELQRTRVRWVPLVGFALAAALLLVADLPRAGQRLALGTLMSDTGRARCVAADEPVLLIELSLIGPTIAARCPLIVDPTGVAYETDRGAFPPGEVSAARTRAPDYQLAMRAYFGAADTALFGRPLSLGLAASTWAFIHCTLPNAQQRGSVVVLSRSATGAPAVCRA